MSSKKKIYFWFIIFGVISLFFFVFVIPKFLKEIRKNSGDLISSKSELASLREETKNFSQLAKIYQNYQSNLTKINGFFIDPEVPIEFIKFLEKNAILSQQKIEISLASTRKTDTDPWPSLFFQISTYGSFSNFLKFLGKLENSPYLIEILDLNTKKLTEGELQSTKFQGLFLGDVGATFSIKVYTQ